MTTPEMLEALRGKVLLNTPEEIQEMLNEIADKLEVLEKERNNAVSDLHKAIQTANLFMDIDCLFCKHRGFALDEERCPYAKGTCNGVCGGWEWYGGEE